MSVLSLTGVRAGYGCTCILDGVDLNVDSQQAFAILGPNGSGKSTLIKTVMGLTTLFEGTITWNGRDLTQMPAHRRAAAGLGYMPQTENIFPGLSVLENLQMGAYLVPAALAREELERVFALFPILRHRHKIAAGSLSGGERRMLSLGTVLMMRPKFLLLDEPTSDLSPTAIDVLVETIRAVRREYKLPILMVEQNVRRTLEMTDRVCVLVRGQKRLERAVTEVNEVELGEVFLQT